MYSTPTTPPPPQPKSSFKTKILAHHHSLNFSNNLPIFNSRRRMTINHRIQTSRLKTSPTASPATNNAANTAAKASAAQTTATTTILKIRSKIKIINLGWRLGVRGLVSLLRKLHHKEELTRPSITSINIKPLLRP